jgi:glutamine amidotransferase
MSSRKAAIIDIGLGNLGSLVKALSFCQISPIVIKEPKDLDCNYWVLPGVGSFSEGMRRLVDAGFDGFIKEIASTEKVLGICLGMQMLGRSSTEGGEKCKGLSILDFEVVNLQDEGWTLDILPHIGYQDTYLKQIPAFKEFGNSYPFYYVHSFVAARTSVSSELECAYFESNNVKYISGVSSKNVLGVQFHPEKSHKQGLKLFSSL